MKEPGRSVCAWHHRRIDGKQQRAEAYGDSYRADYGFEDVMVRARQKVTLELIGADADLVVVEVGCGTDLLVAHATAVRFSRWVIVEPNSQFALGARAGTSSEPRVRVVDGFFQDALDEVRRACGRAPDVVLLSSVLHEVDDPLSLLAAARRLLAPGGRLIVNVPNAASLHRRLALVMGLIASLTELSDRNTRLGQPRVLDADALTELVSAAGFAVGATGGYFLKPFTHTQMAGLTFLDDQLLDGLSILGGELPSLAAEIYAVATVDPAHAGA